MRETIGPIAVGGVGGSGTRIVAAFLQSLGVFIGEDLNPPLDNRWFTLLFKRRSWASSPPSEGAVHRSMAVFETGMCGGELGWEKRRELISASAECFFRGHNLKGSGRGVWAMRRATNLLSAVARVHEGSQWGWKEPNTHIFLKELSSYLPNMSYIHVIRDGLAMSSSRNWDQAALWGTRFSLPVQRWRDRPKQAHMLSYWVRANEAALDVARKELPGRHRIIRFETMCSDAGAELGSLAEWLSLDLTEQSIDVIASVRQPLRDTNRGSWGRVVADISESDRAGIERLGYSLPSD